MGIFGVNMPLLYGEGKKAFKRLQQEIIKGDGDQSIFAWVYNQRLEVQPDPLGMLAQSPQDFAHCREIKQWYESFRQKDIPYHMTNIGLQISVGLFRTTMTPSTTFVIFQACVVTGHILGFPVSYYGVGEVKDGDVVSRSFGHPIALFLDKGPWRSNIIQRTVVIREHHDPAPDSIGTPPAGCTLIQLDPGPGLEILETWPECEVIGHYKPLIECAVDGDGNNCQTFFRIRMEATERHAEFVVAVVPNSKKYTTLVQARVFEWEIFRSTRMCNDGLPLSLAGLFLASPEMLDSEAWPTDESKRISAKIERCNRGYQVLLN
jgi:hypothetical protein